MKLAVEVKDIVWDTDGETVDGLPEEMAFEVEVSDDDDLDPSTNMEINEAVTGHMSDASGWCVSSFSFGSVAKVEAAPAP